MTDDVRLGRDGVRTGWLTAGGLTGCVAALLAAAAIGWFPFSVVLQVSIPLVAAGVGAVWMLTRRVQDVVVLDDDGVRVEGRAGPRAWAWTDLLEVGAVRSAGTVPYLTSGLTVLLRPEGGAWDTPGPNAPHGVALPVFGRAAQDRAIGTLRDACGRHGVPFNGRGLRMAEQPRPGSLMRTDGRECDR